MGAELWHYPGLWREDPAESLFEVQVRLLREAYDLPDLLDRHLGSARDALRLAEADPGDPYGLLGFYRSEVARLEALAALPPPAGPREEIERLRALYATSGQGIGDVLDVTAVSDRGGLHVARRLPAAEVRRLCGTDRPSGEQAVAAVPQVNAGLGRGDSVCFPFYTPDGRRPAGWYFIGNTID